MRLEPLAADTPNAIHRSPWTEYTKDTTSPDTDHCKLAMSLSVAWKFCAPGAGVGVAAGIGVAVGSGAEGVGDGSTAVGATTGTTNWRACATNPPV